MADPVPTRVWWQRTDVLLAIGVIVIVLMLIIPIPAMLLDFFIAVSFALGLITIITVMYMKKASELSVFPSLLLVSTLSSCNQRIINTAHTPPGTSFQGEDHPGFR